MQKLSSKIYNEGLSYLKIALTTKGKTLESKVSKHFRTCAYLLVVETNDLSITIFPNDNDENIDAALKLTDIIIKQDCEAVITGEIERAPLNILADACVSRYTGVNLTVRDSLQLLEEQKLSIIRGEPEEGSHSCGDHCHEH